MIPKLLLTPVEIVDELIGKLKNPLGEHRCRYEVLSVTVDYDKCMGLLCELRRRLEEEEQCSITSSF